MATDPQSGLERCLTFIHCQLQPAINAGRVSRNGAHPKSVTISRQAGSDGHVVAEELAKYLQSQCPKDPCPWTVFDRELVERVLDEHHLPKRLAKFMPEDRVLEITDTMDELFGLHPPSWTLVQKTAETILHLVELGHVIILGRGAQVLTRKLPYVFQVRLVGSLEKRIEHIREVEHWSNEEARKFILRADGGRKRYLKKYFGRDIDDPLLYHLVLNTDLISYANAARMIGQAVC